jgi:hypothetical protein
LVKWHTDKVSNQVYSHIQPDLTSRKITADNYKSRNHFLTNAGPSLHRVPSENATENGGGEILINLRSGRKQKVLIATIRYSNNYRAEAAAVKFATENPMTEKATNRREVTDALSFIVALKKL